MGARRMVTAVGEMLMLNDSGNMIWFLLVVIFFACIPVYLNFQRLENKYELGALDVVRLWCTEVWAYFFCVVPVIAWVVLTLLLGHWFVWLVVSAAMLLYVGAAMVTRRLRSYPLTIRGTAVETSGTER